MSRVLYILYNADASVTGKLAYGYRKLTAAKDKPACAACDITHGGLHLNETEAWKAAKSEMMSTSGDIEIKQLHRDELGQEMRQFIETRGLRYPLVLQTIKDTAEPMLVMDSNELAACNGDAVEFARKIRDKSASLASEGASRPAL